MEEKSTQTQDNNKRIAKNTLMLYLRMFLTMVVGLYTSRVVLQTLGVEDYGIYGVVGGIVSMMGFLNASMSGATSRFLTFELGRGNKERLGKTFSSALIVHIIIATIVFVVAETIGLWFLCNKLVIPEGRMVAAHWVYQLSILSSMLTITQVPYNSSIIAHEKMDIYAYVEILNVTLKLLIVYLLLIGNFDKLILYSILTFAVSVIIMMVYRIYCLRKFAECRFHWIWDKEYLKPLISFSGWDLYGNFCYSIRQQGAGFVLNAFYGVAINAASGIATTVQGVLLNFSNNVVMAVKPQIIKSYAKKDYENMNSLIKMGTKISFLLSLLITAPILFKIDCILELWLGIVPPEAVFMSKALLVLNMITSVNLIAIIAIHASGKMKLAGVLNGTLLLSCIPIIYILLKCDLGYKACYVLFVIVGVLYFALLLCVISKQVIQFEIKKYLRQAISPIAITCIVSLIIADYSSVLFPNNLLGVFTYTICSIVCVMVISYLITLNQKERTLVNNIFKKKLYRKCRKRRFFS